MTTLYSANVVVLVIAVWAIWVRRDTFHSRWDAPFTLGIVIFGSGVALDSPWREVAAASFVVTGKYFLLNTFGHICFLAGAATGIYGIYMRLLPPGDLRAFMRSRIWPAVGCASAIMLICVVASPVTSTMPADHLYLVRPDGWLTVYWVSCIGTVTVLEVISTYGMTRLRRDADAVGVDVQIAAVAAGGVGSLLIGVGIVAGRNGVLNMMVWPLSYLAIGGGAVAAAFMWRHRVSEFSKPPRNQLPERLDYDGR